MYIAMNRFPVRLGAEADFEAMWARRESHLDTVPGFLSFHLLRGPAAEDHVVYATHTAWDSEAAFLDWTRSEAFRKAHAQAARTGGADAPQSLYLGPPRFEGFTSVLSQAPKAPGNGNRE
ncbi:MAG: antibiotic biosynthesis monooxygenase [Rhodobacterales bacterium]|nr:antibiotic biosynthesis monooxygenase [Rhodobacterales bacterium]